jgi:NAD(P)-dependent dehydrogenase (short-subunit alcohol dehydrogenase family)
MLRLFLIVLLGVTLLVFIRLVLLRMKWDREGRLAKPPAPPVIDADSIADPKNDRADFEFVPRTPAPSRVSTQRLAGKCAIVTGAGSGIGRAIAIAFAREGARIALVGRTQSKLDAVAKEIGSTALALAGDISQSADIERIVSQSTAAFGRLDILVNNAALLIAGTALSHTEAEWDSTFNTNVRGVWLLCRAAIPHMQRAGGGSIVNISSALGLVGAKNRVAYAASKGALTLMTKAMALDHATEKIRVNCICPGIVETEMVEKFITQAPDPETARKQRVGLHPVGRFGRPEDIAALAVYLASDESQWTTGAAFPVDGGYTSV